MPINENIMKVHTSVTLHFTSCNSASRKNPKIWSTLLFLVLGASSIAS